MQTEAHSVIFENINIYIYKFQNENHKNAFAVGMVYANPTRYSSLYIYLDANGSLLLCFVFSVRVFKINCISIFDGTVLRYGDSNHVHILCVADCFIEKDVYVIYLYLVIGI